MFSFPIQGFKTFFCQEKPEYKLLCQVIASMLWGGEDVPFLVCASLNGLKNHDVQLEIYTVRESGFYMLHFTDTSIL